MLPVSSRSRKGAQQGTSRKLLVCRGRKIFGDTHLNTSGTIATAVMAIENLNSFDNKCVAEVRNKPWKGGSLNYHLGRQGPGRRGGDWVGRRSSNLLMPFVTRLEVPRPSCPRDCTSLGGAVSQWCPPLAFFLKTKGLGTGGSPHRSVHSIEYKLGGIGWRGGAQGEGGAEDQWC